MCHEFAADSTDNIRKHRTCNEGGIFGKVIRIGEYTRTILVHRDKHDITKDITCNRKLEPFYCELEGCSEVL